MWIVDKLPKTSADEAEEDASGTFATTKRCDLSTNPFAGSGVSITRNINSSLAAWARAAHSPLISQRKLRIFACSCANICSLPCADSRCHDGRADCSICQSAARLELVDSRGAVIRVFPQKRNSTLPSTCRICTCKLRSVCSSRPLCSNSTRRAPACFSLSKRLNFCCSDLVIAQERDREWSGGQAGEVKHMALYTQSIHIRVELAGERAADARCDRRV